jgi:hypothetical protein
MYWEPYTGNSTVGPMTTGNDAKPLTFDEVKLEEMQKKWVELRQKTVMLTPPPTLTVWC